MNFCRNQQLVKNQLGNAEFRKLIKKSMRIWIHKLLPHQFFLCDMQSYICYEANFSLIFYKESTLINLGFFLNI